MTRPGVWKCSGAQQVVGHDPHLSYNIALCHYRLKDFAPALKHIAGILTPATPYTFGDAYLLDTNFDLWKAFTLSYLIWFLGFSVYWILMELWGSFPVFHQRGSRISNSNCWKMSYWCKLSGRLRWCVNFLMCLDSNPIWHFKKAAFTEVSRKCITFAIWRIWSFYKRAVFWLNEINM